MRTAIAIGLLYAGALGLFRYLGGFNAAGKAFERWGSAAAAARRRGPRASS